MGYKRFLFWVNIKNISEISVLGKYKKFVDVFVQCAKISVLGEYIFLVKYSKISVLREYKKFQNFLKKGPGFLF